MGYSVQGLVDVRSSIGHWSWKTTIILANLALAGGIIGIRRQLLWLLCGSVGILFCLALTTPLSKLIVAYLSLLTVSIYALPQWGWLFGMDAHSAALIAQTVRDSGWPVQELTVAWGFPSTPLLHIHAAIGSVLTNLPIYPGVHGRPLITGVLPVVYVLSALGLTFVLARSYSGRRQMSALAVLPLILWVPLYDNQSGKIAFRRHSLALVLFILALLALYLYFRRSDRRQFILLTIAIAAVPATHHLSAVFIIAAVLTLMVAYGLVAIRSERSYDRERPSLLIAALLSGMGMSLWFLFFGYGGEFIVRVVVARIAGLFAPTPSIDITNTVDISLLTSYRTSYAKWLFQIPIALGVISLLAAQAHRNRMVRPWPLFALLFGGGVATFAAVSLTTPSIPSYRLMTLFLTIGGPLAVFGAAAVSQQWLGTSSVGTRTLLAVLFILSVSLVPPHVVTDTEPDYSAGERSYQFERHLYASAFFADEYVTAERIVGDSITKEIKMPIAQTAVVTGYRTIQSTHVSSKQIVILRNDNNESYYGKLWTPQGAAVLNLRTTGLLPAFDRNNSAVYSNGEERMYT